MTAWSRKTWRYFSNFCVFWKTPLMVKFSKFCSESFHRLTDRRCCVGMSWIVFRREIAEALRYLGAYRTTTTKIRLPLKLSLLRGSRPKSARSSPRLTLLVHIRRNYSRTLKGRSYLLAHRVIHDSFEGFRANNDGIPDRAADKCSSKYVEVCSQTSHTVDDATANADLAQNVKAWRI